MYIKQEEVTFTEQERAKIAAFWNSNKAEPPTLGECVFHLSNGETDDPRSKFWGKKTRKIIAALEVKPRDKTHVHVEKTELTSEQQEFIRNHIKNERIIDICRNIFPDRKISPLGREVRAVTEYLKSIGEYLIKKDEGTIPEGKYEPPKTFHEILKKVNDYLHIGLTTQSVTAFEKKSLEIAIQFLHSPRFVQEINNYTTKEKRLSFESEFIRAIFSKNDLSPEEVSLTINWCSDILQAADLRALLEKLNNDLNDNIGGSEEGRKHSQALAVTIGEVTTNLNEVLRRQERIYGLLNKSRSKRDEDTENKTANIAQLFEFFRDEENRKKMLRQAELLKEGRKEEKKRLESLDDIIFLSLGLSSSEI